MARTILFSTHFPANHPKAGHPTYFVEKIWGSLIIEGMHTKLQNYYLQYGGHLMKTKQLTDEYLEEEKLSEPKYHTIRKGNRFKVGDTFSPRVWSGAPYRTPQQTIAPDTEIKRVWQIEILHRKVFINGVFYGQYSFGYNDPNIQKLAINDGLSVNDFDYWFGDEPFNGQIICWSDKIDYSI